ncbi:hypothetical protein KKE33_01020 [Patescibacteria group bacterium]|nr:hypothetical protein [Patescibacteria group bacterium]
MGEAARQFETTTVEEESPVSEKIPKEAEIKNADVESMHDFMERMSGGAAKQIEDTTESGFEIAKDDPVAVDEIRKSQDNSLQDLAEARAEANKKIGLTLGADWMMVELEDLDNVKLPANDNQRVELNNLIEQKKTELEELQAEKEDQEEAEKEKELEEKKAEVLKNELKLLEQTKERDVLIRSIQKSDQVFLSLKKRLEREQQKPQPNPVEIYGIEGTMKLHALGMEKDNSGLAELGSSIVALDGLLTRSKLELRALSEGLDQKKLAEIHEKLEKIKLEEDARVKAEKGQTVKKTVKNIADTSKFGARTVGAFAFLSLVSFSKVMKWVDKGLGYIFENDIVDKLVNLAKAPEKIINWIGKKVGVEDDGEKQKER